MHFENESDEIGAMTKCDKFVLYQPQFTADICREVCVKQGL